MKWHLEQVKRFFETASDVPLLEWAYAATFLRHLKLGKGETFFRSGEPMKRIGLLTQGLGVVYFETIDGKRAIRRFIRPGDPCTSYPAVIRGEAAMDTFEALEDTVIMWMDYKDLVHLMSRNICWERVMRRSLEREIEEREHKEYELFVLSAPERYEKFKKRFPELLGRVPQYMVASHIGITPVALSRIISKKRR
jgi:CRP-like cAMP-binding protein